VQIRYVAVCDKLGRHLKTYPIATAERGDGPGYSDLSGEALERARREKLVPESELTSLVIKVPKKVKLWR
jgi:hypothetical protein